jgi:hypothetical protein
VFGTLINKAAGNAAAIHVADETNANPNMVMAGTGPAMTCLGR